MSDKNKPTEETDETQSEEHKEEPSEEQKEESPPAQETKEETEETPSEEKKEEKVEDTAEIKEEVSLSEQPKKEEKPVKSKPKEETKEFPKKKDEKKDDFKYIVRVADTDIDGNKKVIHGLTQIKGIGWHMSILIADAAGIDRESKIGDLTEAQIDKIKDVLTNLSKNAPTWMLNHRKDYDTGKDIHLISSDIDMRLRDNVNVLKMIRSYRGIRHEMGLPVRGQRTRAHGRTGLAMGVSRKKVQQEAKTKE